MHAYSIANIHTARCTVRQFAEHDIDDFMVYRNDMDWMRYQGFKGLTRQKYADRLLGDKSIQSGLQLAIICNESNTLIGDVYLKQEKDVCWIGYSICRNKARQGYAYEVVFNVINILKGKNINFVKAGVEPDNTASIALLKKLGFTYVSMDGTEQIYIL